MVKFLGSPFELVRFNPPIGLLQYVRFDENGEYVTENARVINRFHHHFDSVPAEGNVLTPELSDDDLQLERHQEETKQFACKKCEFVTESKGLLMSHYRSEHPKEE